jgi:hypothetical protein
LLDVCGWTDLLCETNGHSAVLRRRVKERRRRKRTKRNSVKPKRKERGNQIYEMESVEEKGKKNI